MRLVVEMECHILPDILQVNLPTWLYFVKIVCITSNISPQWIKMKKEQKIWCKCNEGVNVYKLWHFMFTWHSSWYSVNRVFLIKWLVFCERLIILHKIPYILYDKCHSNTTNVGKCVTKLWKSSGQFMMVDFII